MGALVSDQRVHHVANVPVGHAIWDPIVMPKLGHHDTCHFGNGVKHKRRCLCTDETEAFGEVP